jgi:hypothetical protein
MAMDFDEWKKRHRRLWQRVSMDCSKVKIKVKEVRGGIGQKR